MTGVSPRAALPLLLFLAGCSNGVTLVVDLRTDLRPDFEFRSVELLVTRPDGSLARRSVVPVVRSDDFLSGQRVGELVDLSPGAYGLDTRLRDGTGAAVVARHTSLELREDLAIVVIVTRDCRGLVCPEAGAPTLTECLGGRCVSPACVAGDASACPPPACTSSADCTSTIACAPAFCAGSLCLAQPDDTRCASTEWCDPSHGCVAIPPPDVDAGGTDAGAIDAGAIDAGAALDAASVDTGSGCTGGGSCSTGRDCETGTWECVGGDRTCVGTVRAAGDVCRPSAGPCDRAETCDGASGDCPPDRFFGSSRGCRAGSGACDPGESCDGSGPDCPPDDVASDGTGCGATWSELGCGPVDTATCQGGRCVNDGTFSGGHPSCGGIGAFCGFTPRCCGSGGMFCVSGSPIYGSSSDCSQCCEVGSCCMDGNPAGPCI
jgi:hypothetical protein